jgi:hypothetical protein
MSHFSDIGFRVESEDALYALAEEIFPKMKEIPCPGGSYCHYRDPSGAELWMQLNEKRELLGLNPHFEGKSSRRLCLTAPVERSASPLDGAYHAWAEPQQEGEPESGHYPLVFDLPNARLLPGLSFPSEHSVQVTAFARDFHVFDSVESYYARQEADEKSGFNMAAQSFIPTGLFKAEDQTPQPPKALAVLSGKVRQAQSLENSFTGQPFHHLLIETFGGNFDVVADAQLWPELPPLGGVVNGHFWLSGKLSLSQPQSAKEKGSNLLQRLFGRKKQKA